MNHPNLKLKNESIFLSRFILEEKDDYLILDTETTGIGEKDVIIQLGVIDLDGNVIIDSLIKPKKKKSISRVATDIHGITSKQLQFAPHFADVFYQLLPFIEAGKKFLIYNFEFDARMINQTIEADELGFKERLKGRCIMLAYSRFVGEWNPLYGDFKYQKLPGGDHSAVGDCQATLKLIKKMASHELEQIPEGYQPQVETKSEINVQEVTRGGNIWVVVIIVLIFLWVLSKC